MKFSKVVIFSLSMLVSSIAAKHFPTLEQNINTETYRALPKAAIEQFLKNTVNKKNRKYSVRGIEILNNRIIAAVATDAALVLKKEITPGAGDSKTTQDVAKAVLTKAATTYTAEQIVAFLKFVGKKAQNITGISTPSWLQGESEAAVVADLILTTAARAVADTAVNSLEAQIKKSRDGSQQNP